MTIQDLQNHDFLFDSHAHLNDPTYEGKIEGVLRDALDNGINMVFDISVDLISSMKSIELAKKFNSVSSFIGIDPEKFIPNSSIFEGFELEVDSLIIKLEELIQKEDRIVEGIGEIGLDFYWIKELDLESQKKSRKKQIELFESQLFLAQKYDRLVSIHSRGAERECLEIAKKYNCRGIFHSYTGDFETAKGILDAGLGLGANGIVTFKNANELREMYRKILGKMENTSFQDFYKKGVYFETDSPYLSPEGNRGEINFPARVRSIYDKLVEVVK